MNQRRTFSTQTEAEDYARQIEERIERFGAQKDVPNDKLVMADAYAKLVERLAPFGRQPEEAVDHYVQLLANEVLRQSKPSIRELVDKWEKEKVSSKIKPLAHRTKTELKQYAGFLHVVAARLLRPIKNLITKGLVWTPTEIPGTCVAEMAYQEQGWSKPRRLILIRHQVQEKRRVGGKRLFDCPGYLFQGLVTSLAPAVSPLEVWRQYNGRAGIEHVIRELRHGYGLQQFCCQDFWATEAVLSMVVMAYNLVVLFERFLGWMDRYAVQSLRFHLFTTAGIISQTGGITTIKLAAPPARRSWWMRLWERIASPFPNCNAVEPLFG